MRALVRAAFAAHASTRVFASKLERSLAISQEFLDTCETACVAVSFGKDSVVMLHLLWQLKPDILALHCDRGEGGDTTEIRSLKEDLRQTWGLNLHTVSTEKSALECFKAGLPIRKYLVAAMQKAEAELGIDGTALGITHDESRQRALAISRHGPLFKRRDAPWRCYPIGHWTARDVWAYTVTRELPYLGIYDALADVGIDYASPYSRTSNIVGTTATTQGRFQYSAWASPEMREFYRANEIDV